MTLAKFAASRWRLVVLQLDRIRKINELRFRHSLVPKSFQHPAGDSGNARRVLISERLECVEHTREPALLQHPESDRGVGLHVLNVKHVRRPFQFSDEPRGGAQKQRWRNDHEHIRLSEE